MLRGAEIVLQCLRAEGVDLVFGYPGGAMAFFHYLDYWRNKGDFAGREFR